MLIESLGMQEFERFIATNDIVFVDFWAQWCAPCKPFATVYEAVSAQFPDIQFAKVNVQEETALSEMFEIRSIPHLMVFKKAVAIYSQSGNIPAATLTELVQQALDADVSEILDKLADED